MNPQHNELDIVCTAAKHHADIHKKTSYATRSCVSEDEDVVHLDNVLILSDRNDPPKRRTPPHISPSPKTPSTHQNTTLRCGL
jgi:hypothetical protein